MISHPFRSSFVQVNLVIVEYTLSLQNFWAPLVHKNAIALNVIRYTLKCHWKDIKMSLKSVLYGQQ